MGKRGPQLGKPYKSLERHKAEGTYNVTRHGPLEAAGGEEARVVDAIKRHLQCGCGGGPFRAGDSKSRGVRRAWELLGNEVTASCIVDEPGTRPWGWWRILKCLQCPRFDPEHFPIAGEEAEQLHRMAALTQGEIETLTMRARETKGVIFDLPFRRHRCWWLFVGPEQRNTNEFETEQLIRLDVLTPCEREIIADPKAATRPRVGSNGRTRFGYLSRPELQMLGLAPMHPEAFEYVHRNNGSH